MRSINQFDRSGSLKYFTPLALLFLSGCFEVSIQDARELFENGKLPELIDGVANPKPRVTEEQIRNAQTAPHLRVAVIDNGVDYNHPYLRDKISYDYEGNKVVGAGYDVMGQDRWSHPNIFDVDIMSFGATVSDD